jgi:hypothetical protein
LSGDTSNAIVSVYTNIGEGAIYEISLNGIGIEVSTIYNNSQNIDQFALFQNYPNPFNPITHINYFLPKQSNVKVVVFDLIGNKIKTLINMEQQSGFKTVEWNATNDIGKRVSAGIYFYDIQAGDFRKTRMMVLLK